MKGVVSRFISFLVFVPFFCEGCATAAKLNKINLGMTKQEVIKTIGKPNSTKATSLNENINQE